MFEDLFKKSKYITIKEEAVKTPEIPQGMWEKCKGCETIIYGKELKDNLKVCPSCGHHFHLNAMDRLAMLLEEGSFKEMDKDLQSCDPLNFPGYKEKLKETQEKTDLKEGVITGTGILVSEKCVICVMDSRFFMGSLSGAMGEKITRAVEYATLNKLPLIIFTASGGARMQEGIVSLMQMEKVSAAIKRHSDAHLLYISVLTNPTTGGVTASFAMLSDIILAEPGALIGFAGKRVVAQTIKKTLPEDFQTAEFLLSKGFIDSIVERKNLKQYLYTILKLHKGGVSLE